jgi:hypothetical protein
MSNEVDPGYDPRHRDKYDKAICPKPETGHGLNLSHETNSRGRAINKILLANGHDVSMDTMLRIMAIIESPTEPKPATGEWMRNEVDPGYDPRHRDKYDKAICPKPETGEWTEKTVKDMCHFLPSDFKLIADAHNAALAAAVACERQLRPAWDKIKQLKDEIKELMGNKMTEGDCQIVIGALDSLGVALADKKHQWTEGERAIYEKAIEIALGIGRREPPTQAFIVEINGEDVLFVRLDDHNAALAGKSLESSKELLMERDELKQQLAAAQAAIVHHNRYYTSCKPIPTDTTALDAAIAEAIEHELFDKLPCGHLKQFLTRGNVFPQICMACNVAEARKPHYQIVKTAPEKVGKK